MKYKKGDKVWCNVNYSEYRKGKIISEDPNNKGHYLVMVGPFYRLVFTFCEKELVPRG